MFDMSQVVEELFQDIEEIREAVAVEAIPHLDNQVLTAKQVQAVLVWQVEVAHSDILKQEKGE